LKEGLLIQLIESSGVVGIEYCKDYR